MFGQVMHQTEMRSDEVTSSAYFFMALAVLTDILGNYSLSPPSSYSSPALQAVWLWVQWPAWSRLWE